MKMLRWAYPEECESPPPGWEVQRLVDLVKVVAGQSPPSDTYNTKGIGTPFLQGNADFSFENPTPTLWCSAPLKVAKRGDVLISVRAPVGEINRADQDYAIGRGLAAVRAISIDADFLYFGLQRWRSCLERVAQGTTFDAVTARHFYHLHVAIPAEIDEQIAIARIAGEIDAASKSARRVVHKARRLKAAILQRFFYSAFGETAYANRPKKPLPKGWALVPTGSLLEGDPKNGVSPETSSQPPGVPSFSIAAIRDGEVNLSNANHLKFAQLSESAAKPFLLKSGDVLIVRGNANPDLVGKAGMVGEFPEGCIYPDITKRVAFLSSGQHVISPSFAVLAWNHAVVHNQILRRAKTSQGTLKINNRDVKDIVIPVPPPEVQTELVNLMKALSHEVRATESLMSVLSELKRYLLQALFTGAVRLPSPSESGMTHE